MWGSFVSVALARFPRSGSAELSFDEGFSAPPSVEVHGVDALSAEEERMISGLSRDSPCLGCPAMVLFPETLAVLVCSLLGFFQILGLLGCSVGAGCSVPGSAVWTFGDGNVLWVVSLRH